MNFCLLQCATNIGSPSFSLPPSLPPPSLSPLAHARKSLVSPVTLKVSLDTLKEKSKEYGHKERERERERA